jgi:hypothetical protein
MIEIIKCPYCGNKQRYEHADEYQLCEECGHYFEAELDIKVYKVGPDYCKCDPSDWKNNFIQPVCPSYADNGGGICLTCEHLPECHK